MRLHTMASAMKSPAFDGAMATAALARISEIAAAPPKPWSTPSETSQSARLA